MTPEQIDGFINAWVWVDNHGREITGIGVAIVPVAFMPRIARRVAARRDRHRGLRRLEQYANHPGSRPILDDFHTPRKEDQ
ncbi:MAG: hypothetical protein HOZ81_20165 [Streptomyces sp.]|nr:hypothetical protein [Streptomyces sp.]NUS81857.1 hypothetical protein [Streptomyces sp.]